MQALKQNTVHDITLDCSISHKSETMIRQGQQQSGAPSHNSSFSAQRYDRAQGLIPYPTNNSSASVSPRSISPRSSSPRSVSPRSISPRLMTNEQTNTLGSNLSTKSYEELYAMGANSTGPNNLFQYEQRPGVSHLPIPPHQQMSFPNMKPPSPAQSLGNAYSYQQQLQQNQGNFAQQPSNGSLNDLTTDLSRFSLQGHSPNGAQKPSSSNLHHTYMQGNGKSAGGARTPPGSVPQQHQTRFSGYMDYAMQQPANHSQQQHQSLVSSFRGGFDGMPHFQQPLSQLPLSGSQSQLPSVHGSPRLGYSQTGFNPGSTDILSAATASIIHNTTSSSNGNSSFIPSAAGAMPTTTAFTELDSSNYGDFLQEMRMQKLRIQRQQQQLQSQSQLGSQLGYLQQLSRSSDTGNESGTGNHLNTSNPSGSAGLVLFPSVSTSPRASSPRQLDTDGAFSSIQSTDSLLASLQSSHQPLSQSNLLSHNNSHNDDNDSGARKLSSSVQQFLLQDDERTPGVEEVRGEETEGDLLGAQTLRFVLEK